MPRSGTVREIMDSTEDWFMCHIGSVETVRAVSLSTGRAATEAVREEWPAFGVIEVDQRLVEDAAKLVRWRFPCVDPHFADLRRRLNQWRRLVEKTRNRQCWPSVCPPVLL